MHLRVGISTFNCMSHKLQGTEGEEAELTSSTAQENNEPSKHSGPRSNISVQCYCSTESSAI